ncbi:hypothetical protein [Kribbella sp. VKM Ac-2568]
MATVQQPERDRPQLQATAATPAVVHLVVVPVLSGYVVSHLCHLL